MLRTLQTNVLDTIFPPRCLSCAEPTDSLRGLCPACWADTHFIAGTRCAKCGAPLIGEAGPDALDLCESCQRHPPAWDRGAAALLYRDGGRRLVLALKHGDRLDMVRPLAGWMAVAGRELLDSADLIAPVPLHWRRLLKRRYNQAGELARALGRSSGRPVSLDLLTRRRFTTPQEKMDHAARARNQAGAFALHPRRACLVPGRSILLVDDVMTSGATLSACAETLRAAGALRVDALVLARVAFET